jgi:hypothetical protein
LAAVVEVQLLLEVQRLAELECLVDVHFLVEAQFLEQVVVGILHEEPVEVLKVVRVLVELMEPLEE